MLKQIDLQNFRNYKVRKFSFSSGSTLFVGDNSVGKTNVLEAIWLLATGKSFRATLERQMIRNSKELARVVGRLMDGRMGSQRALKKQKAQKLSAFSDRSLVPLVIGEAFEDQTELEVVLTTGEVAGGLVPKKRYMINGIGKRRVDFVGSLRVVLFRPEDLELILGSPSVRRDYLDSVLEQVDREYRRSLLSYKKGLRQRNKLLERIREAGHHSAPGKSQLLFWNQLLIKNGEVITEKREEFVGFINGAFDRERISQVFAGLELVYDRSVISEARLKQYAEEEVAAGVTLVGPHRDDFSIIAELSTSQSSLRLHFGVAQRRRSGQATSNKKGRDLAIYGSRGEQRLAILALKLAELSFVTSKVGERPLLLLDDIFSELDHEHREVILDVMQRSRAPYGARRSPAPTGAGQTIVTTTDLHLIEKRYRKQMQVIQL